MVQVARTYTPQELVEAEAARDRLVRLFCRQWWPEISRETLVMYRAVEFGKARGEVLVVGPLSSTVAPGEILIDERVEFERMRGRAIQVEDVTVYAAHLALADVLVWFGEMPQVLVHEPTRQLVLKTASGQTLFAVSELAADHL